MCVFLTNLHISHLCQLIGQGDARTGMYVGTHVCASSHVHGGQWSVLDVPQKESILFLKQGPSLIWACPI